jgi:hypothetical protein
VDASLCPVEALICASGGTGLTGRGSAPSAGLTEQLAGFRATTGVPTCLRRAVSALPVRMWSLQARQLTVVIPISNRGARSLLGVVWFQLSYHLHDLCAVAEDPAAFSTMARSLLVMRASCRTRMQ